MRKLIDPSLLSPPSIPPELTPAPALGRTCPPEPREGFPAASPTAASGRAADLDLDASEREAIGAALAILDARLRRPGAVFDAPARVREFLALHLAPLEAECFAVLFLDAQHALIEFAPMFAGTLSQTSVYPREVVRRALRLNAGAVILAHNHPSGVAEPSRADEVLTSTMKAALALVDVRVIDHVIVGGVGAVSMAERGIM